MDFFLKFDITFLSIILLLLLFFTMLVRRQSIGTSSQLFYRLIWATITLLVLEILSWTFDGIPEQNTLNYISNLLYSWSTSIVPCIFASYIDYHMFGSYNRLKRRWFYLQPFILTGLLLIINLFVPIIVSVSHYNVYRRESLMFLLPLISSATFLYICYLGFKNRATIKKEIIWTLLLYFLIPAVVAFLQIVFLGIFILWPTISVIIAITYIFLETISLSKDYLTGLLSRHRIDDCLEFLLDHNKELI